MSLRKSSLVIAASVLVGLVIMSLSVYGVVRARARSASATLGHSVVAASTAAPKAAQDDSGNMPSLYYAKDPEPVPPFLLRDLAGNVVLTAALKGKVVI